MLYEFHATCRGTNHGKQFLLRREVVRLKIVTGTNWALDGPLETEVTLPLLGLLRAFQQLSCSSCAAAMANFMTAAVGGCHLDGEPTS
jgi:hypothetical protein